MRAPNPRAIDTSRFSKKTRSRVYPVISTSSSLAPSTRCCHCGSAQGATESRSVRRHSGSPRSSQPAGVTGCAVRLGKYPELCADLTYLVLLALRYFRRSPRFRRTSGPLVRGASLARSSGRCSRRASCVARPDVTGRACHRRVRTRSRPASEADTRCTVPEPSEDPGTPDVALNHLRTRIGLRHRGTQAGTHQGGELRSMLPPPNNFH